jgi:tyrosine-protein phosphatase YwqE
MGASEIYRQKADLLLRLSSEAHDAKTRAFLLEEALYWHQEATEAAGITPATFPDDEQARAGDAKP